MSSSATIASTTQPLSDILPWGSPISVSVNSSSSSSQHDDHGISTTSPTTSSSPSSSSSAETRTLLVTDATSTDARFVLHTLALQFLSSRHTHTHTNTTAPPPSVMMMEGAVLWISCEPRTDKQIMMGLRKGLQHNLGGGHTASASGPASSWMGGGSAKSASGMMSGGTQPSSSISSQSGGAGNTRSTSSSGRIHIISIPLELADAALDEVADKGCCFSHETYLKQVHQRIAHWLKYRELLSVSRQKEQQQSSSSSSSSSSSKGQTDGATLGPNLVIIDNATALGALFGDQLSSAFLSSVRSLLTKYTKKLVSSMSNDNAAAAAAASTNNHVTTTNLLAIRASSPDDGGLYQLDGSDNSTMKGEKLRSEYARLLRPWLGFGSGMHNNIMTHESSSNGVGDDGAGLDILQMEEQSNYLSLNPAQSVPSILYKSGMYEVADGIVDVSPLESGYARDVLGRLSFVTTWNGRGWWGVSSSASSSSGSGFGTTRKRIEDSSGGYVSLCVNYRCDDSGVRVMRLRSR